MALFALHVNGIERNVDVAPDTPLLWVLREALGLTGTKFGCGMGLCGACTVHLEGAAIRSCITPVSRVGAQQITTIEGLTDYVGLAVQGAWVEQDVPQCGYCQSGQIMAAAALLAKNKWPTVQNVNDAMSGNLCRCGTYQRIRLAIERAAKVLLEPQPR